MTTPESVLELLINTADTAARYAAEGQFVEGYAELVYGWRRAQMAPRWPEHRQHIREWEREPTREEQIRGR